MKNIVIFGPPGSGKGTQSRNLSIKYNLIHVSTGQIIRDEISTNSEIGLQMKDLIEDGQLVPDKLIIDLLDDWLKIQKESSGIIFDGFPRTTAQAAALKEMLALKEQDVSIMLSLDVPKKELINRLTKRGQGRSDDNPDTIAKRIKVYDDLTAPVINFYKTENKHVSIPGVGEVDEIFESICKHIDKIK